MEVINRTWIPDDADILQLRLLIFAHCNTVVHCGSESTEKVVMEEFRWTTIKENVREFVSKCIHCLLENTGHKIPRPLAETLHGKRSTVVVHLYLLYVRLSHFECRYALVIKYELSKHTWLRKDNATDAETPTTEL